MNSVYYALGSVILAIGGVGLVLALPKLKRHDTDLAQYKDARAGLGASLLTGAVISGAFFVLQVLNQAHQTSLANKAQQIQRETDRRQTLRLKLTLQNDLSHADLSAEKLSSFDFTGKVLTETNFRAARLTNAHLDNTRLDGATFDGARLDGSDLTGAIAKRASFDGATLTGATFIDAVLDGATFGVTSRGAPTDLSGAKLIGARLTGACLAQADLRNAGACQAR